MRQVKLPFFDKPEGNDGLVGLCVFWNHSGGVEKLSSPNNEVELFLALFFWEFRFRGFFKL